MVGGEVCGCYVGYGGVFGEEGGDCREGFVEGEDGGLSWGGGRVRQAFVSFEVNVCPEVYIVRLTGYRFLTERRL